MLGIMPSKRVARALFPVDHEEQQKFIRKQLQEIEEECKARWNFDFKNERPLEGKLQWEKVGRAEETIPEAYKMPQLECGTPEVGRYTCTTPAPAAVAETPSSLSPDKESISSSESSPPEDTAQHRCATPPSQVQVSSSSSSSSSSSTTSSQSRKRKQSQITDFFSQRKKLKSKHKLELSH